MEDDVFRLALLALGSCIILAVLVHGIWISRKNSKRKAELNASPRAARKQQFQPGGWQNNDWQDHSDSDDAVTFKNDEDYDIKINFKQGDDSAINSTSGPAAPLKAGEFDDLGLGAVRVVGSNPNAAKKAKPATPLTDTSDIPGLADFEPSAAISQPEPKPVSSGKVYASVVTQPKPEYAARLAATPVKSTVSASKGSDEYQAPEPPPFLLKKDQAPSQGKTDVDVEALKRAAKEPVKNVVAMTKTPAQEKASIPERISLAEQARNLVMGKKAEGAAKKRREPKIAEDQMRIDFDDAMPAEPSAEKLPANATDIPQEVLVLNVKTAENAPIQGAALLPMLLTLGFKFGDQDIFHRHVNSNGKGPVLFSLANMFKPGNFDIDNLENFTTMGISLFMILPIEGDPHQVFNMMHNAARKIADEFSAQVYDGRRALLTKQSLQQYVEKIREFERKRMVNR